jgi:cell division protein FtsN
MSQTTQQYNKKCTRYKEEILMSNEIGKWRAMEIGGVMAHTCSNNGNSNNNDYSRDIPGPLRPTAFTDNNNDNDKNQALKQQQQQEQQQQPQQQVYPYSVKIEQSSSGAAKISIHTYNVNPDVAKHEAIRLFIQTKEELTSKGVKVLEA